MKKMTAFLALIMLVSCTNMTSYWSQHGGHGGLTFAVNTNLKSDISQAWDAPYGRQLSMVWPVADSDNVYVVVDNPDDYESSCMSVISKKTGMINQPLFDIGKGTSFSLVCDRKSIILSNGPMIMRLDKTDMSKMWEFNLDEFENVFQFSSVNEIVFLVSDKGNMYCLDKETGMTRWQQKTDENYFYRWCCSNETISLVEGYSSEGMMKIMAFENVSGDFIWQFETEGDAMIPPQMNGERVIINSTGQITQLDIATGKLIWSQLVRSSSALPVKIEKPGCYLENVYYLINGNMLTGYDDKTGTIIDQIKIPVENQLAGMVASKNTIFIAFFGKEYLYTYDIGNKQFQKKFEGDRTVIGMGISDGLIVQTIESILYFK
jgi:outer membrane protein assembly factor BamB